MRKIFISFFIIFFILFSTISFAEYIQKDHTTYFGTTDSEITIRWGAASNSAYVTHYELRLYHVEREVYVSLGQVDKNTLSKTIKLPRTGHFIVYVRSVNEDATDESKKYSPWINSTETEHAQVNNEQKSWWLYGHVAKPGAIIFDFNNIR